jgi:hypothetical protein
MQDKYREIIVNFWETEDLSELWNVAIHAQPLHATWTPNLTTPGKTLGQCPYQDQSQSKTTKSPSS